MRVLLLLLTDYTKAKMGDAGGLYHPRAFQPDLLGAQVVEEFDALPEQYGHQVDRDLFDQPGLDALLRDVGAPTPTFLSPATALACSTALSTPSVTKVNGDPS